MEKLSRLAAALPDGSPIKPNVLKAIAAKQGRDRPGHRCPD
jgi:hypothetical protein